MEPVPLSQKLDVYRWPSRYLNLNTDLQLDSDDELFMPYDMLNDTPEVKFKKSLYLQDIITGLSGNSGSGNATDASKTADLFEQTIADAEQIIMCADEV